MVVLNEFTHEVLDGSIPRGRKDKMLVELEQLSAELLTEGLGTRMALHDVHRERA